MGQEPKHLAPRHKDVLNLCARGYSNKEIAAELGIAVSTVQEYFITALRRLNANNRTHAVVIAIRGGHIDLEGLEL